MKTIRSLPRMVAALLLLSFVTGCASSTMIRSVPSGAKVYMDDEMVGETPYKYSDTKIVGSQTSLRLEKEGYAPLHSVLIRNERADVGAIIGGIFLWIPFLWTMGYKPTHTYELKPLTGEQYPVRTGSQGDRSERLRKLKSLFDDGIITKEEFEREKKQILEENP